MNIYIGYKYRSCKDKQALKNTLLTLSDRVHSLGHKTFILERDVYDWCHDYSNLPKSIRSIIKNMKKSDVLLAFVDCDERSIGLLFESLCAKVFGKKVVVAVRKGLKGLPFKNFANEIVEFDSHEELFDTIQGSLKNLK